MNNTAAIGIFDSGIGGLTVLKALQQELPRESFIYLGDTARVPYGSHTPEIITQFSFELLNYILRQKVKIIVVACNTIAATCLEDLRKKSPVPIISVIEPTIDAALIVSATKRIGVIGTRATIQSEIYKKTFSEKSIDSIITQQACPLFVPIVEENLIDNPATEVFAREYLKPILAQNIDTLVFGCTHYPLLKNVIQKVVGNTITIIDSAQPTALYVKNFLEREHLNTDSTKSYVNLHLTELSPRSNTVIQQFLGNKVIAGVSIQRVQLMDDRT